MLKIVAAGATALFLTTSPLAYAQQASSAGTPEGLSATDWSILTEARINLVKAALQLTPEQEKYWPAIENAIRTRASNRRARVASAVQRVDEMHERGVVEVLRDRNPVDFLHRRATALAQRAADLNKLADAWQPLYQTLSSDQKRRLGFLTVVVLRDLRYRVEDRRMQSGDDWPED